MKNTGRADEASPRMNVPPEVAQYLGGLLPERRVALEMIRDLIFETVPEAVESMDYRMPTYRFRGNPLCAVASRKKFMAFYLHTCLLPKYHDRFKGLNLGKECVRFRSLDELPLDAVRDLLHEAARVERA